MKRVIPYRNPCRLLLALGFLIACGQLSEVYAQAEKDPIRNRKSLIEKGLSLDQPPNRQRIALILLGEIGIQETQLRESEAKNLKAPDGVQKKVGLADPNASKALGRSLAPKVIELLKGSSDPMIKAEAALTLGKINPEGDKAIPALIELFNESDANIRIAAIKGLRDLLNASAAQSGKRLFDARKYGALEVRGLGSALVPYAVDLAWARAYGPLFGDLLTNAKLGLPTIGNLANDSDPQVRKIAQQTLVDCAKELQRLIPDLRQLALKPIKPEDTERAIEDVLDATVRWSQLVVLEQALSFEIPKISSVLQSQDPAERLRGTRFLESLGLARLRALTVLKLLESDLMKEPEELPNPFNDARKEILDIRQVAFQDATPDAPPRVANPTGNDVVLPKLLAVVRANAQLASDSDYAVRLSFADVIESLEGGGIPVLDLTLKLTNDENRYIRWTAIRTLGRIAPKEDALIVPQLGRLIVKEQDLDIRIAALYSLERFEAKGQPAIESVIAVMKRGDADGRAAGVRALEKLKAAPDVIVPPLAQALRLKDEDSQSHAKVRLAAAQALHRIGKDARLAVNELTDAVQDDDTEVRTLCAQTLLMIGQEVLNEPKEKR